MQILKNENMDKTGKETWQMTFTQFCDHWLENSKYKNKYLANEKLWEDKKKFPFGKLGEHIGTSCRKPFNSRNSN